MKRATHAWRRTEVAFAIGAPFVTAFVWGGAYLGWTLDPTAMGPAQPPWFHDPLSFLGLSFIGSMLEAMMLAVLIALTVGAVKLG